MAVLQHIAIASSVPDWVVDRIRATWPEIRVSVGSDAAFAAALRDADAAVAWNIEPSALAAASGLKWFQTIGAGVDDVLTPELVRRGILLTNNSGVHAPNIAEHLLALMLAFARRLPFLVRAQARHEWRDNEGRGGVFELSGQTLLIAGMGDIGVELASRAKAFGLTVHGLRRRTDAPTMPNFDNVVGPEVLQAALGEADHVALCLPLTPKTRGLIGPDALAAMKQGAFIYNVGRGPLIETGPLIDALRSGHLGGAGLDVTDPEPLPADSPLWAMENVIITAHTSGATPRYWDRASAILIENIERFLDDRPMLNLVDPEQGY